MRDIIDMEVNMCINETKCKVCKCKMREQTEEALKKAKKQLKIISEADNFDPDEVIRLIESVQWMENRLEELK